MTRFVRLAALLALCALTLGLGGCGDDQGYDAATSLGVQRYGAPRPSDGDDAGPAIEIGTAENTTTAPPVRPKTPGGSSAGGTTPTRGPSKPKAGKYTEVEVTNGGTISGTVKFASLPARRWTVEFTKDQKACGHEQQETQRVIYDPATGTVANCIVYLADITEGKAFAGEMAKGEQERTVLLDQKGCTYVPHIVVMRTNTQIVIKNSDPAEHNVHMYRGSSSGATQANVLSPAGSEQMPGPAFLEKPTIYEIKCDIHAWMNGYAIALNHPYAVVTGTDGTFELTNVPPGEYSLVVWHEGMREDPQFIAGGIVGYDYGKPVEQVRKVTVEAGATVEEQFEIPTPVTPKGK